MAGGADLGVRLAAGGPESAGGGAVGAAGVAGLSPLPKLKPQISRRVRINLNSAIGMASKKRKRHKIPDRDQDRLPKNTALRLAVFDPDERQNVLANTPTKPSDAPIELSEAICPLAAV